MKLTFTGFSLLAALILFSSWSCSKKQSDTDAEISIGTPSPIGAAAIATPNATTALSFAMPSPTVTPEPMEYEVEDIQGTVLALFEGESDPETVEEGETLEEGDSLITRSGSQATLSLSDVTAVQVSESTTVKIADLEPKSTQGFISRLELTGGKVLSEVEELDKSDSTFEVESDGVVCGVRGTAFEVQNQDGQVQTNTFHGSVEVAQGEHSQLVKGGEHSAFSFTQRAFLTKRKLNAAENKRYSAWGKIYKRARQKRAQRMEWIRTKPQTPEAQKFLQRRENWRQKRFQFRQANPSGLRQAPQTFDQQIHPKPPVEKGRQQLPREKRLEHRNLKQSQGHQGQTRHKGQAARQNQEQRHPGLRPQALSHPAQQKPQAFKRRPNLEKNSVKPHAVVQPRPGLGSNRTKPNLTPGKKNPPKNFQKKKLKPQT